MEVLSNPYFWMPLFALVVKAVIAVTLGRHWRPGLDLFLIFLVCSLLQTLFEIGNYILLLHQDMSLVNVVMDGYYLTLIASIILLPFSVASILGKNVGPYFVILAITLFCMIAVLLLGTNLMIEGYAALDHSYTRIAGQYYWIFQVLILMIFFYNTYYLVTTYFRSQQEITKIKCANMLFGFAGVLIFVVLVVFTMAIGIRINGAGMFPILMSIYLIFMSINIRDTEIYDIRYKLPWTEQYKILREVTRPYIYKTVEPIDSKELTRKYNNGLKKIATTVFDTPEEQATWLGVSRTTVTRKRKKS